MGASLEVTFVRSAVPATAAARVTPTDFMSRLEPFLPALKRFALRLTGNVHDSEDLLQDMLLKLFERPERLADIGLMQPWLARVMYHQFIDRCRRNAPQAHTVSIDAFADAEGSGLEAGGALALSDEGEFPEELVERLQVASAVTSAIGQLPEQQRALVRMHDIEGLSLGEIAAHCGLSVNTVKSSLSRARVRLRQDLLGGLAARGGLGNGNWRRTAHRSAAAGTSRRMAVAGD